MTAERKKILMVGFFDVFKHKRLTRQVHYLKDSFDITVAGFFEGQLLEGVRCYPIEPCFRKMNIAEKALTALLILAGRYEQVYNRLYGFDRLLADLGQEQFDLIIAHDFKPLPLVEKIRKKAPVLINAHEYHFDMGTKSFFIDRFNNYLLNNYFLKYSHYVTVCQGIADEYGKNYSKKFQVITNAHEYVDILPSPVQQEKIRMIYHGLAHPARQLEGLIEMMDHLGDRFQLDLMLTTLFDSGSYVNQLRKLCGNRSDVRIIEPVHPDEIVPFCNQYDIGIFVWPDTNINFKYIFPNKFFEFVQSRLMIATGPSVEVRKVVDQYELGVVSPDFDPRSMANMLQNLTSEQISKYKQQTHAHALELSSEIQMQKLAMIIENILVC